MLKHYFTFGTKTQEYETCKTKKSFKLCCPWCTSCFRLSSAQDDDDFTYFKYGYTPTTQLISDKQNVDKEEEAKDVLRKIEEENEDGGESVAQLKEDKVEDAEKAEKIIETGVSGVETVDDHVTCLNELGYINKAEESVLSDDEFETAASSIQGEPSPTSSTTSIVTLVSNSAGETAVKPSDDVSISEVGSSPSLAKKPVIKSATPSPVLVKSRRDTSSLSSQDWHGNEDDIDRLVAIHTTRSSLSSLGIRSDSMASVYSGAGEGRYGDVTVKGQVEFGLQYNYKANSLEILIKQCKELAAVDTKRNRSDPYVKVYLLPDKSKSGKRKTRVKKHTLNPIFDETLKFNITLNGLETRTLWLTVWHSDMFGRNDFLGEVMMTLENKVFDDPAPRWYNLQERTEPFEDVLSFKGDILVGLKFVPPDMTVPKKGKRSRGALHVKVKEARSLTAVKASGISDPFCKSYLLPEKGRNTKQKTVVIKKTINPVWNHTFIYDDVTLQELAERCLELTVWDHDRLGSNEFLGGVRFSLGIGKHYGKAVDWMDSTGKELSLWKSMLERPNFWVEGCLPLRPTLDNRAT